MRARSTAPIVVALAIAAAGCGRPAAPGSFAAESTMDLHRVHLTWSGACTSRCDLEAWSGDMLGAMTAPAGSEEATFQLPESVGELTRIGFRIRDVDGSDESDWVVAIYDTGISWPTVSLFCSQSGPVRQIALDWTPSGRADGTRLERAILSPFDAAATTTWEDVPLPAGAISYLEPRPDAWADGAILRYRIRSLAGSIESHPIVMSTSPGAPLAPEGVAASVDGGTVRVSWTGRSRIATSLSVRSGASNWDLAVSLPPLATSYVETGVGPGFRWYSVEALCDAPGQFFDGSGPVYAGVLVPDPALDAAFAQRTVLLPWTEAVARVPAAGWALGWGFGGLWSRPAGARAPEGDGWARFDAPANRILASPGPVVDARGRVHAFFGPGPDRPALSTGPIVHVWRDGTAWHEEQVGYAVSLLPGQLWAAASADGSLHALWRSEPGIPVASYATDRGGSWAVEQVPGSALVADAVSYPLAVDPSGDAVVLLPSEPGAASAFTFHRRAATGWTAEDVPDDPAVAVARTLAVLAPSADRTVWLQDCGRPASWDRGEVCLRERTASGWGASAVIATAAYVRPPGILAASPDGSRLAVALGGYLDPISLLVLEGGATRSWTLANAGGGYAVGFDDAGKLWLLSGIGATYAELASSGAPYALYEER